MDIKAVLFDKDGTLIDFAATFDAATGLVLDELCNGDQELLVKAAEAVGYDLAAKKIMPHSIVVSGTGIQLAEILSGILQVGDVEEFGNGIDRMFGEICINTVSPIDGAEKALDRLHGEGLILGMSTNDIEENAVDQMEAIQFDHMFETILGRDSGYGSKPGPGMANAFVNSLGLQPYQVMMVGDSVHDLEAGLSAGMVTVAVETGPADREELELHADFVIPSVRDLPELLAQNGSRN